MTNEIQPNLHKWEMGIAYLVMSLTPLLISINMFDSYLLPKIIWLMFCTAIWLGIVIHQPVQTVHFQTPLNMPLLAVFLVSLISILIHYQSPLQIRALLNLAMFIALFFGFHRFWCLGGSPNRVTQVLLVTACIMAIYALLQDYGIDFATPTGGVRDWRSKVIASLGNPNFLAGYLGIFLPIVLGYGLRKNTGLGGFFASSGALLSITACITVTFSVGTTSSLIGSLFITIITALVLLRRIRISILKCLFFLVLILVAVGWYMLENPYNSHGRSLYRQAWESPQWWSGMGSRIFNWQTTRLMIEEAPCTGIGFGNYLAVHEQYQGYNYKKQWHAHDRDYVVPVDQPHFQLLETAAELGPLGVFALCWLVAAWVKAAMWTLRHSNHSWFAWGSYAGVWVALIHTFSDFPFHLPASSLLIVVLGSYLVAYPAPKSSPPYPVPSWTKTICIAIAIVLSVNAYMQFLGNHYLRKGYESEGLDSIYYLDKARSWDPWSHETYFLLGQQYSRQGWNRQAIETFHKAIALQEDIQSHKWLARIYQQLGNREEAIRELERIIDLNPVYPGHYRDLIADLGESADPGKIASLQKSADSLDRQLQAPN